MSKSNVRNVTYNDITMSVAGWARQTGLSSATITKRLDAGWSVEQALTEKLWSRPVKPQARADHDMRLSIHRFACEQRRAINVFEHEMYERLKRVGA